MLSNIDTIDILINQKLINMVLSRRAKPLTNLETLRTKLNAIVDNTNAEESSCAKPVSDEVKKTVDKIMSSKHSAKKRGRKKSPSLIDGKLLFTA